MIPPAVCVGDAHTLNLSPTNTHTHSRRGKSCINTWRMLDDGVSYEVEGSVDFLSDLDANEPLVGNKQKTLLKGVCRERRLYQPEGRRSLVSSNFFAPKKVDLRRVRHTTNGASCCCSSWRGFHHTNVHIVDSCVCESC